MIMYVYGILVFSFCGKRIGRKDELVHFYFVMARLIRVCRQSYKIYLFVA